MSLLTRFDTAALRPPEAGPGTAPAALLVWCQADHGPFAWQATDADAAALNALMRSLDGEDRLRTLGRAEGLRWRLSLKLREALGLRRAQDPWDCGHARGADALLHFLPRRPTLIVSDESATHTVLAARASLFRQPVRLLLRTPAR